MVSGSRFISLPKNSNRHVMAALIHAIALAHHGLSVVSGWCADSPIARVRLAVENARLKAELALLREELRLKDGRLARIPAHNRPRYPPTERRAA